MPVAYGIFLAVAQLFLNKPNNVSIDPLSDSEQGQGRSIHRA